MMEICLRMNMSMKDVGTVVFFVMENEAIPSKHIYVNTPLVEHIWPIPIPLGDENKSHEVHSISCKISNLQ